MKKLFLIAVLMLTMVGCASKDYKVDLKKALKEASTIEYERVNNHKKKYYSFYIDKSVSSIKSENAYSVLEYLGNTFVMNLNVKEIVDDGYFEAVISNYDKEYLSFSDNGYYYDDSGVQNPYHVLVYEVEGSCYLVFKGKGIYFISLLDETQVYDVALKMMSILKSVKINDEIVVSSYSANNEITYVKESTELFTSNVPTTTTLEEIINRNGVLDYEEIQIEETLEEQQEQIME